MPLTGLQEKEKNVFNNLPIIFDPDWLGQVIIFEDTFIAYWSD